MTKKQQLFYLIEKYLEGAYITKTFCNAFEDVYYPDIPFEELTADELEIFNDLAGVVTRFSPYEADFLVCPKAFCTEAEVEEAIYKAHKRLNQLNQ